MIWLLPDPAPWIVILTAAGACLWIVIKHHHNDRGTPA